MLDTLRAAVPQLSVRGRTADYTLHDVEPGLVLEPRSAEEAATILRLASEHGWRVECAGGNTYSCGNRRTRADIVLTARQMDSVVEYEPADLVIGVQAGMHLHRLQETTARNRQFLALDPPAHRDASIGGVIAAARSGPLRYAHGTARDHVLGLQVVTGDGRVLQVGGRVVKNVAGYDLVRLLVGSAGSLAFITQAFLRLKPLPVADATVLITASEPKPLIELAQQITNEHLEAAAMELLSAGVLTESWALLVRLQGNLEAVQDAGSRLSALARNADAGVQDDVNDAWKRLATIELDAISEIRLADLPARLDATLQQAHKLIARSGGEARVLAHAGDGIVRVLLNESNAEETAFAVGEARSILGVTGGTVLVRSRSAELMRRVDAFGADGVPLQLMSRLKQIFDPAGVLAAGRFVV